MPQAHAQANAQAPAGTRTSPVRNGAVSLLAYNVPLGIPVHAQNQKRRQPTEENSQRDTKRKGKENQPCRGKRCWCSMPDERGPSDGHSPWWRGFARWLALSWLSLPGCLPGLLAWRRACPLPRTLTSPWHGQHGHLLGSLLPLRRSCPPLTHASRSPCSGPPARRCCFTGTMPSLDDLLLASPILANNPLPCPRHFLRPGPCSHSSIPAPPTAYS